MNKYIFKTILSAALAFPVLTSCELDQYPAGTIPAEEAWQSTDDANNFYIGLLSYLRSYAGTLLPRFRPTCSTRETAPFP